MDKLTDPVVIGVAGGPHGVRGTIKVKPIGSGKHLREGIEPIMDGRRYRINRSRPTPKGFLVDFDGVADRSQVASLRGHELTLDRRELDELDEEEFYVGDLVGMKAFGSTGEELGDVVEVIATPAHEILLIEADDTPLYVPFTSEHVPELDIVARRLTALPPEA